MYTDKKYLLGGESMLSLKLARIKKGLTQKELCEKSGVSAATICNIERNGIDTIPVKTLKKLAKALDTTVSTLFFSDEE